MNEQKPITHWHQLLAELLRLMLQRLGITVVSEPDVMTHSPRADVLLMRRETADWTEEQLRFLPSGIRESNASNILIEFKKTESLTDVAVVKIAAYDIFYRDNNKAVKLDDVLPVIVSAKHPRKSTLERLGFVATEIAGVYQNENPLAKRVQLLSLNQLPDTAYNAYFKLLASQKRTQERAVSLLRTVGWEHLPTELTLFLATLWHYVFDAKDDEPMIKQMTADQMIKEGEIWMDFMLQSMSPKELLTKVDTKKLLAQIPTEERLSGISAEELEAFLHQLRQQEQSAEKPNQ